MHWRSVREADLEDCLRMQPACIGDAVVGPESAHRIWQQLFRSPAFMGNVICYDEPPHAREIVACGLGVFVDRDFVDSELANPRPGLNARIIASLESRVSVVLDSDSIAAGNAGSGLDFVNLYGTWRDDLADASQIAAVKGLLGTSFVEAFAGFRFNRILKETIGESQIALARATGTYRLIAEFPVAHSALAVVTPDSAREAPYSLAARVYRFEPPVLRLRPAEQALLRVALDGKTDAELSAEIGLSVEAVKKRWVSIFGRFDEHKPEVLGGAGADSARRGPQKRHRVVAYIRAHPEELRPYRWPD